MFVNKVEVRMRKPLVTRIAGLTALYCAVFFVLVVLQFSSKGNFLLSAGEMTIRGRYLQTSPQETSSDISRITGGAKVFYGGLEFNLSEERGKGLILADTDGILTPVNPDYLILTDNTALFGLPDGTVIAFNSFDSPRGPELRINAEFAENISEVTIPIMPRRSSLVSDDGQLGVMYGGSRYLFGSPGQYLENGMITLSKENAFISYRSRGNQSVFDPADYITAQSQNYESALLNWKESNFTRWNQNASSLQNEDDIIAYCAEALTRGSYAAAVAAISGNFLNSSRHTYRSAVFTGGMTNAYDLFSSDESQKLNHVTLLTRERSLDILKDEHILDYLFTRNNTALANDVIDIIQNASPEMLTIDYCPGLLEAYLDIRRWRPAAENPVEKFTEQILFLVSEHLTRDTEKDLVFASNSEGMYLNFSLRLGKALVSWMQTHQNNEWQAIGRSLVLSALTEAGTGAGRLYNILNPGEYYPRAVWLTDTGHWAWTASPSVRASYIDGNLNFALSFPAGMTHYVIIRGVRPFIRIQIHDTDWRTDSQFERYDSSGWVYYSQGQTLILKLRHRATLENVRIVYRVEEPPPPPPVVQPVEEAPPVTEEWRWWEYQ